MGTADLVAELNGLSNADRLEVIEAATRMIRDDLLATTEKERRHQQDERFRAAAEALKDLYEPGREVTEWSVLDAGEIYDDTSPG